MKKCFWILLLLIARLSTSAQGQPTTTSADIYLGLKKLKVLGSVLYIAAHPDDENTRLLTYLSKDRLYRTGYLSLTRGDGGQNLIGDEQGISLGLIRTQELLAARRIDGAEQFFSRAYDFGYSKTPEETFTKWDRNKILSDVVWVIRKFQPDVIITRFPTTGEGGHGHHTASAILANEAFTAAADPSRFPEQLQYVRPWAAKRILWNGFNFNNTTPPAGSLQLDVGGYNAVLGKSYGEISALSRSQHKSQGFGSAGTRGESLEYFKTTGGPEPAKDILDDVNVGWSRLPGSQKVSGLINSLIDSFAFDQPQKSLPGLFRCLDAVYELPEGYWKNQKIGELRKLIEQASGLWIESSTAEAYVAQSDSLRVSFVLNDRLGIGAKLNTIKLAGFDTIVRTALLPNRNFTITRMVKIAPTRPVTQPYWLANKMEEGYFNVYDQLKIGQADADPALPVDFEIAINGINCTIRRNVVYKFVDQVKGEQNQPLTIVPPVSVYAHPELLLLKKSEAGKQAFEVQATANTKISSGPARITVDFDGKQLMQKDTARLISRGNTKQYTFNLSPADFTTPVRGAAGVSFDEGKQNNAIALASIKYDHIPYINFFYTDWIKLVPIDLKTAGKKIGYITGAGDRVPEALEAMGYEVTMLTDKELARTDLRAFDAIISGVRAFNTNEWMNTYYEKLMQYVQGGGNYIVQYSQSNNIRGRIGPYPFVVSGKRITDENAAVTFLQPAHPALNFPNRITNDDFTGWIQERSIYHASNLDSNYVSILRMNDPNEAPDDGSLVIAKYGKGYFTYTGLVFFRELPAGVSGAYRLLANLIALNNKKEF